MVELCELKMMNREMDYWPDDIDQHVAQLDFDNSSSMIVDDEQSLFESTSSAIDDMDVTDPDREDNDRNKNRDYISEEDDEIDDANKHHQLKMKELVAVAAEAGIDGSIVISTDSLDMDLIRDCSGGATKNRNDYKLIFEDSGQWTTTSGIGASVMTNGNASPPTRRPPVYRSPAGHQQQYRIRQNGANDAANEMTINFDSLFGRDGRMLDRHFGLRLLEHLNKDTWTNAICDTNEKERSKLVDSLIKNITTISEYEKCDGNSRLEPMTTWGRIQSIDSYDARTNSMQNVCQKCDNNQYGTNSNKRPFSCYGDALLLPAALTQRPQQQITRTTNKTTTSTSSSNSRGSTTTSSSSRASLVANFVEQQHSKRNISHEIQQQPAGLDYEYSETYLGNGRYVDVNENEIGYVPESTASIQHSNSRSASSFDQDQQQREQQQLRHSTNDNRRSRVNVVANVGTTTHVDLPPSFTAPDLKFLSLTHKTPPFCRSQISLDEMLRRARNGSLFLSAELFSDEKVTLLADTLCGANTELNLFPPRNINQPDSGLGSSSSSGPAHIEDWPSLAFLLPKNVVDACSFFKTNSSLLTGSSTSGSLNNIERKTLAGSCPPPSGAAVGYNAAAGTCHACLPVGAGRRRAPMQKPTTCSTCCCFCQVTRQTRSEVAFALSQTTPERSALRYQLSNSLPTTAAFAPSNAMNTTRLPTKLNTAELGVVGLPLYNAKRTLVERVVEGVAEIARGSSAIVLYSALTRLLADGLLDEHCPWSVIVAVTGNGSATNHIFNLVKRLEVSEKPENSRVDHFFKELLGTHSLEGWLSYVVLKENVLVRLYADTAFLPKANGAYRSLFWRIVESLELLSVLSQCSRHRSENRRRRQAATTTTTQQNSCYDDAQGWGGASRLPSDSRVPKSSSIPEKMTTKFSQSLLKIVDETFRVQSSMATGTPNENFKQEVGVASVLPSTSTPVSYLETADAIRACSTLPRAGTHHGSQQQRRPHASRIPVALPSVAYSMTAQFGYQTPLSSLDRSRSTARGTPMTARAKERVSEKDASNYALAKGRMLSLDRGERVRVLSVRGDLSRCCRLRSRFGALLNGVVPTKKLDLR